MSPLPVESGVSGDPARPSARYVALLVLAAMLVLLVGGLFRPKSQQQAVQANELATLPELSQRRVLRDMAGYLADRAAAFSASVVYLPEVDASGLVLGGDSIVSVPLPENAASPNEGSFPVILLGSTDSDTTRPSARVLALDTLTARWVLVVGRTEEQGLLSLSGLTGGLMPVECGGVVLREILLDAVVPPRLRGAGVFDLDGNALALAVPCDSRIALVPLGDALRLLP